jgi:hypothetical protein
MLGVREGLASRVQGAMLTGMVGLRCMVVALHNAKK